MSDEEIKEQFAVPLDSQFQFLNLLEYELGDDGDYDDDYKDVKKLLFNHGWRKYIWPDTVVKYGQNGYKGYYSLPTIISMPSEEMLIRSIHLVPGILKYRYTYGDMLLMTAWSRKLSPRPILKTIAGKKHVILNFDAISQTIPYSLTSYSSSETLDYLLLTKAEAINTTNQNGGRGLFLVDFILEKIRAISRFNNIKFILHPRVTTRFVYLKLSNIYSLIEILDALKHCIDIDWEWVGEDRLCIFPRNTPSQFNQLDDWFDQTI